MEYLAQILANVTGDSAIFRVAFTLTIAVAVFVLGIGFMYLVAATFNPLRRRLRFAAGQEVATADTSDGITKALEPLTPYILPKKDWEKSRISEKLVHAGFRSTSAMTTFYTIKTILVILLPGIAVIAAPLFPHVSLNQVIFVAAAAGFSGVTLPNLVLEHLVRRRVRRVRNGFPDTLDLLVVCSEAGLGLNAAIGRVGVELVATYPELAEELELVNAEVRVGVDRVEALRNFASRSGVEEIRGLVALLAQSLRLGTGVAKTLRVYAEEFRDKRMQAAEEKAAKLGTKMIFPLILCLFPGFFAIAVGPAVLRVLAELGGLR